MTQENTLDKKVAESFMEDSSSVDLSTYTEIPAEAAEVLSGYGKREGDRPDGQLDLSGLTEISEECAEALENHAGETNLYGLNDISPEIANKLAKKTGALLLNGLKTISLEVAEALSNHSDGYLSLDGLEGIDEDIAEALAKHTGGDLSLDGLESIDEDIAEALAKHTGGWLSLGGLSEISEGVAEKLITSSDELRLGITKVSDPVARVLASFTANLIMAKLSIEEISNLAAYLLSNAGFDDGWTPPKLRLKSSVLTKDIAEEMVQNGFPESDVMEEFTSLEESAAEVFGGIKDSEFELHLTGLKSLSDKSAELLTGFKGNYLNFGVVDMSDEALENLSRGLECELTIGNKIMTDTAANILKDFNGPALYLGITEISMPCAEALAQIKGCLHLNYLKDLSEEAAKKLAKYSGPELSLVSYPIGEPANDFEEKVKKWK